MSKSVHGIVRLSVNDGAMHHVAGVGALRFHGLKRQTLWQRLRVALGFDGPPFDVEFQFSFYPTRRVEPGRKRIMRAKAELRPAHAWLCDLCGTTNYIESTFGELTDQEIAELRDEHGVEPWESGAFSRVPENVTCRYCDVTFPTEFLRHDPPADDPDEA